MFSFSFFEDHLPCYPDLGVIECSLQSLVPLPGLQDKLDKDLAHQKEKAEKVAKTLIEKAVKGAVAKKGSKRKQRDSADGPEETSEQKLQRANEIEAKAKHDQEKLDLMLKEHSQTVQMKTTVPLSKIASLEDRSSRSARAILMQDAAEQAKALRSQVSKTADDAAKQDEENNIPVGIQAAVRAVHNAKEQEEAANPTVAGAGRSKGGKGKGKSGKSKSASGDAKQAAATDMKKLGKHVLK